MRDQPVAPIGWSAQRAALWAFGLLLCVAPQPSQAQVTVNPIANGDSLTVSSGQAGRWIVDIGVCAAAPCITQIMPSIDFVITPNKTVAQVDASEGHKLALSNTPAPWDLSQFTTISYLYEDLNAANAQGTSAYNHYFLIYDDNNCYREWLVNAVFASGLPRSGWPVITPGQWYQVNGSFTAPLGASVLQGGTPLNGKACNQNPLNYASITYFETGIFGGPLRAGDGVNYHWRVGAVTPTTAP